MTDSQAQQLSLARYMTYRLGTVAAHVTFHSGATAVALTGWCSYAADICYAESTENDQPRNLLMWNHKRIAAKQIGAATATPPLPQPSLDSTWGTAQIDTATSELQQVLVVAASLGSASPDNAVLVRQNGARFLRSDTLDGAVMNVYAVPPNPTGTTSSAVTADAETQPSIDYWIDKNGTIRRATFILTSGNDVTITVTASHTVTLRNPFTAPATTP